jgi:hypothetical protein
VAAIVAVIALALLGVGVAAVGIVRSERPAAVASSAGSAPAVPAETTLEPELPAGDVPPLDTAGSRAGASARPGHPGSAQTAPQPPPPSTADAAASQFTVAPPGADPAAAAATDPSFDPERAVVAIGPINAHGVRERAVRVTLRGVGLTGCYRRALRAQGARAVGTATLELSIAESGTARSAIVNGADFLPGLTRCVQTAASGASVPGSQVDPGGGTAEVTLTFRAP